ncbi:aminoglycoside phosphotransferase family protein [Sporosarcina limicola]|uniref:Aminoglycoside phosphotransferase (APT) family kinase protein n=1 Tax=Sporosarcina limicola TaxID=34101 RepID=A0A927R1Q7_9BACL|nr:aminoglycoside phosphotransferase family protein [Sporosarcina limicola]MBE1553036.1 aminoglycoside phosphotransferase (APT) family kinase protein [Sporosarcina limicola]
MLTEPTSLWIKKTLGIDSEIDSTKQLHGGISAAINEVIVIAGVEIKEVVIKQYTNKSWLLEEPDLALHEMGNLQFIQNKISLTPAPIALDSYGEETGYPSILMTKLDGNVVLEPDDFTTWTEGMANALALIHTIDAAEFPRTFSTYTSRDDIAVPTWSSMSEQWEHAVRIVKGAPPTIKETFIHRDFHPTNILWRAGEVSGVVDWVNACRGPANVDVGHCRVNLALLHGVEVADQFLDAYLRVASSEFEYSPYWDFLAVFDFIEGNEPPTVYEGWVSLGVTSLTDEMMRERMESYMISLLARKVIG